MQLSLVIQNHSKADDLPGLTQLRLWAETALGDKTNPIESGVSLGELWSVDYE